APRRPPRRRRVVPGGRAVNLDGWLALCGVLGLVALLASRAIRHLPVTGPVLALVAGLALGPPGLDLVQVEEGESLLHGGSEVLLAISLVAVALRYPIGDLRDVVAPTAVLVTVGMSATAAIGALLAWSILDLRLAEAALLGVVLAPTDPVLASSVV